MALSRVPLRPRLASGGWTMSQRTSSARLPVGAKVNFFARATVLANESLAGCYKVQLDHHLGEPMWVEPRYLTTGDRVADLQNHRTLWRALACEMMSLIDGIAEADFGPELVMRIAKAKERADSLRATENDDG